MEGKSIFGFLAILMLALSGCSLFVAQPPAQEGKVCVDKEKLTAVLTSLNLSIQDLEPKAETPTSAVIEPQQNTTEVPVEKPSTEVPSDIPVRTYAEGDLVKLTPKASDSEGDKITFTYSEPLDKEGEWQTKAGDAGEYLVTVTASDGKATTSKQVRIVVTGKNTAPVIADMQDVTVEAGQKVVLEPKVTDADDDEVTVRFSGWMNSSEYMTTKDDAGEHFVTITAGDGQAETKKLVKVTVALQNRAPSIDKLESVTVKEGELVKVSAKVADADGDDVKIAYSEPLDADGEWQTKVGDAGTYLVTVSATDEAGLQVKETVSIVVTTTNHAPTLTLSDMTVTVSDGKTETVTLKPLSADLDGDKMTLSFSGWMTSDSKDVTTADIGSHDVTVTASDGKTETAKTIKIEVVKNSPPAFDFG